jgi:hypothetical protein
MAELPPATHRPLYKFTVLCPELLQNYHPPARTEKKSTHMPLPVPDLMTPASALRFSGNNCSSINCCSLCYSCYWYSHLSSYLLFGTESINVSNHLTNRACPGFALVVLMDMILRFAALSLPAVHTEHSRIHRFEYFLC